MRGIEQALLRIVIYRKSKRMDGIDINNSTILITGVAGFIGGALALRLIETSSAQIIGIDNLNNYYDVRLKEYRLDRIR